MTVRTFTFPNGVRLVHERSLSSKHTSNIQVFCDVGSIHEPENLRGAAHFIEHMCFKGTHSHMKAHNLLVQYNKIGASFNAYTEKRYTTYTLFQALWIF